MKKPISHDFLNFFVSKGDLLDLQILATVAYSSQFEFPLLENEIFRRLVDVSVVRYLQDDVRLGEVTGESSPPSYSLFQSKLRQLVEGGVLLEHNSYFCFYDKEAGADKNKISSPLKTWVENRHKKTANTTSVRRSGCKLISLALKLGWIKAIGITGSVAAGSAKKDDDLDLLVVTAPGTLWLVRLLVLIFSIIEGKKSFSLVGVNLVKKNSWCFNLWMESGSLLLPLEKHTAFDAFEAIQIDWIYDSENIQEQFLKSNDWMGKLLVNHHKPVTLSQKIAEDEAAKNPLSWLNRLIFKISGAHLHRKNKIPVENLKLDQAFLHDGVSHLNYIDQWRRLFNVALLKKCHQDDRPVGLVTGVFDLLHQGHLLFLNQAQARMKELGGCLLIGVESDSRVKKLKGEGRPIENQEQRKSKLIATQLADVVFILPEKFDSESDHLQLIKKIRPSQLLVSEHTPFLDRKKKADEGCGWGGGGNLRA